MNGVDCGVPSALRFHFLADTHLGFDLPERPRVTRRRRGHDFFANFERVLNAAVRERVDFLLHGGDVFYRSRVSPSLVQRVFLPIKQVADAGIPVILVPGNHERSKIPHPMLAEHPGIHIFHRPSTVNLRVRGVRLALAGFPYHRHDIRNAFPDVLRATGWSGRSADVHLLCVHHCFEGATVGPGDFTFRHAADVIRHDDVPTGFAAVLSGHIHRHQHLTRDLDGRTLAVPVSYPGSIERTSFAEMDEPKGYLAGRIVPAARPGIEWEFRNLPARPMVTVDVERTTWTPRTLRTAVHEVIGRADPGAILRIRVGGEVSTAAGRAVGLTPLRAMAPSSMNVEIVFADAAGRRRFDRRDRKRSARHGPGRMSPAPESDQLSLT